MSLVTTECDARFRSLDITPKYDGAQSVSMSNIKDCLSKLPQMLFWAVEIIGTLIVHLPSDVAPDVVRAVEYLKRIKTEKRAMQTTVFFSSAHWGRIMPDRIGPATCVWARPHMCTRFDRAH